jgi:ubiquinol-cytochrome c reductase cytochrome c subunit
MLGTIVTITLLSLSGAASAAMHSGEGKPTVVQQAVPPPFSSYDAPNAGMSNSTIRLFNKQGQLYAYGNQYIMYYLPYYVQTKYSQAALIELGLKLYQQNCIACHGVKADGSPPASTPGIGFPSLLGLGPATYDFWIESGRMPANNTSSVQPLRRPQRLSHIQALAIAAYLTTLSPGTPYYPIVQNIQDANLSDGAALFALNCAACHTITGDGDALAYSTFSPSLRNIPATQVVEAMRTGPANMPIFTGNLTDQQVRDVVAYVVRKIQHPQNPGGLGLGGIGPVGEGFIGLGLGVGMLALIGFWIGDRS